MYLIPLNCTLKIIKMVKKKKKKETPRKRLGKIEGGGEGDDRG